MLQGQGGKWLEYVRACAEIGIECIDHNPDKRPPTHDILDKLARLELRYGLLETDVGTSSATHVSLFVAHRMISSTQEPFLEHVHSAIYLQL